MVLIVAPISALTLGKSLKVSVRQKKQNCQWETPRDKLLQILSWQLKLLCTRCQRGANPGNLLKFAQGKFSAFGWTSACLKQDRLGRACSSCKCSLVLSLHLVVGQRHCFPSGESVSAVQGASVIMGHADVHLNIWPAPCILQLWMCGAFCLCLFRRLSLD